MLGRRRTDQALVTTQYGYDELGRLIQVTDALNQLTSYAYDKLGHRLKRTLPLGMSETFKYGVAGNMASHTDFNGKKTCGGAKLRKLIRPLARRRGVDR